MKKNEILNLCAKLCKPINVLDLDTRAYNCLSRARIKYVYELALMGDDEILKIYTCGKGTLLHIKDRLNWYIGDIEWEE